MGASRRTITQRCRYFYVKPALPGQLYNAASDLTYNYYLDYNPRTQRYIESDPIGLQGGVNTYGYVRNNPLRFTDSFGLDVTEWARPADLGPGGSAGLFVDHHWLKTDTQEAGMGPMNNQIPAQNGESSLPTAPVQTVDHTGQSNASNAKKVPIPFPVNEQCVNDFIRPGQPLGKFGPTNNCQTFSNDVLNKCRIDPGLGHPRLWNSGKIK